MSQPVTLTNALDPTPLGTDTNPLRVQSANTVTSSSTNSSTSNLANGAAFTGTAFSTVGANSIVVDVFTSHASATDGLSIQQSMDGTNWDIQDPFTVPAMAAGQGKTYAVQVVAPFARVVYTNGGTLTTTFRLATYLKNGSTDRSIRMQDSYSNENDVGQMAAYGQEWNGSTWDRAVGGPNASSRVVSAANTINATVAKAAPGRLWQITGRNNAAAIRYIKVFNKATTPAPGTDSALCIFSQQIQATSNFSFDVPGLYCSAGVSYVFTTGAADNDATAVTAADIQNFNLLYS